MTRRNRDARDEQANDSGIISEAMSTAQEAYNKKYYPDCERCASDAYDGKFEPCTHGATQDPPYGGIACSQMARAIRELSIQITQKPEATTDADGTLAVVQNPSREIHTQAGSIGDTCKLPSGQTTQTAEQAAKVYANGRAVGRDASIGSMAWSEYKNDFLSGWNAAQAPTASEPKDLGAKTGKESAVCDLSCKADVKAPAVTDITTSRDGWKALAKENRELLQAACAEREQYREALEALGLHPMAMQTYCEKHKLVDYNNPEHRNPIGWRKLIVEHALKTLTATRPAVEENLIVNLKAARERETLELSKPSETTQTVTKDPCPKHDWLVWPNDVDEDRHERCSECGHWIRKEIQKQKEKL